MKFKFQTFFLVSNFSLLRHLRTRLVTTVWQFLQDAKIKYILLNLVFYETHDHDHATITLNVNNKIIRSKNVINVLGVQFDSKLQWSSQVAQTINKSKRALHAIKLVSKYLTKMEFFYDENKPF